MSTNVTGGHTVRPRFIWLGVVVVIVGGVLIAAGMIDGFRGLWIAGLVVLGIGAVLCLRGGIMYDAGRHASLGNQLEHAMQGDELPGVAPGEMIDMHEDRHEDRHQDRSIGAVGTERRLELEAPTPAPQAWGDLVAPCGWVLLLCSFALIASEWMLMGDSLNGQNNGYIETGAAIFLGLAGLRCLSPGPHPIAGLIGVLTGVGVLLQAIFATEQSIGDHVVRYGTGGIAVIVGLVVIGAAAVARRAERA